MTRMLLPSGLLALTLSLVGCVYHPGGYDPHTGLMYGGSLRPVCCGPLDPFCSWCDDCYATGPTNCNVVGGPMMDCRDMGVCPPPTLIVPPGPVPVMPMHPPMAMYAPHGPAGGCPTCRHGGAISAYPASEPMYYADPNQSAMAAEPYGMPMETAPAPDPYPMVPPPVPQTLVTPDSQPVPGAQPPMPLDQQGLPAPAPPAEEAPSPMPQGVMYRYPSATPAYNLPPAQAMQHMSPPPHMQGTPQMLPAPSMPPHMPLQPAGGYRWTPTK